MWLTRFQAGQNHNLPGLSSPISRSHCCQSTKGPDGMIVDIWMNVGAFGTKTIGISLHGGEEVLLLLSVPSSPLLEERSSNSSSAWDTEAICFCINLECCIFVFFDYQLTHLFLQSIYYHIFKKFKFKPRLI